MATRDLQSESVQRKPKAGKRVWSSKGEALYIGDRPDDAKWCMAVVDGEPSSNELVALAWGYSPEGVAGRAALIANSPTLEAENERLREALREIANAASDPFFGQGGQQAAECNKIARTALAEQEG